MRPFSKSWNGGATHRSADSLASLVPAPPLESPQPDARHRINLLWLCRLRWGAVIGQALVVTIAWGPLQIPLPLVPLAAIIVAEILVNVLVRRWLSQPRVVRASRVASVMGLDTLFLTALLYFSGGPFNPFASLYLLHIALAAIMLPRRAAWGVVLFSISCFGVLYLDHVPLLMHRASGRLGADTRLLHLCATWAAFVIAAIFIMHFVQRLTGALAAREVELTAIRELSARHEKLTALATLAAGAAHELATPLATIAVVAKELERWVSGAPNADAATDDARLIRQEVDRCRDVLQRMARQAGADSADGFVEVTMARLMEESLAMVPDHQGVRVRYADNAQHATLHIPRLSVVHALQAVLKNAVEAAGGTPVEVHVESNEVICRVQVKDYGPGMSEETLARIGEPFFTTKGPGRGMGLGICLTRTILERLGGNFHMHSTLGQGTMVILTIPRRAQEVHLEVA